MNFAGPQKNPDAVALGRMGGLKGGKASAANMTAKERSARASKASRIRWDRRYEHNLYNGVLEDMKAKRAALKQECESLDMAINSILRMVSGHK